MPSSLNNVQDVLHQLATCHISLVRCLLLFLCNSFFCKHYHYARKYTRPLLTIFQIEEEGNWHDDDDDYYFHCSSGKYTQVEHKHTCSLHIIIMITNNASHTLFHTSKNSLLPFVFFSFFLSFFSSHCQKHIHVVHNNLLFF